ncbi:MAG: tRNA (guanosine(46)-N7)-methyltransferase TrmB [Phycisphaerae bacterium]|nr:tRNA (guanosine(46)-N7)-methyltransferase TrmB [Phycisphaerae bacterium]
MRTNSPKHLRRGKDGKWEPGDVLLEDVSTDSAWSRQDIFGPSEQARPMEIEVGVGKGTFLLARAKQRPDVDFLGIEYAKAYACYTADRVRRAGLTNTKVLHADADAVFRVAIPDESVFRVHVYFPDPWPKRKHHRRRLLQPAFVRDVRRVLQPGGQLLIVTDHRDYFEHIRRTLANVEGFAQTPFPKLLDTDEHVVGTNFEKKYIEEGRAFYRAALLKRI